eukprot:1051800-Rhodomonas_salina.1
MPSHHREKQTYRKRIIDFVDLTGSPDVEKEDRRNACKKARGAGEKENSEVTVRRKEPLKQGTSKEHIVICKCGANLMVKMNIRSHCPGCKFVFNPNIRPSNEAEKKSKDEEEEKERREEEEKRREEEEQLRKADVVTCRCGVHLEVK